MTPLTFKSPDLNPLDYLGECDTGTLYTNRPTSQHCRA